METNRLALAVLLAGLFVPAQAQQLAREQVGFDLGGSVDVRQVENAGLQPDSEEQVDETQTVSALNANGMLQGPWAEFATDYRFEDRRFSEFSEGDERILLGESQLILGPQHRRYFVQFSHESRELSLDPLVEDLPSNRDNRDVSSGMLFGSIQPGRGNRLSLWAEAADIQFDQTEENESVRHSLGINFDRAVSPVYSTGVALSGYDLKYRYIEGRDLSYSRAVVVWRARLRKLQYGADFGVNSMETEVETTSSPEVKINATYQPGMQILSANYSQFLSDSSQGSNQSGDFGPIAGIDGRLDGELDQFKSRQLLLSWRHEQPCRGCEIDLSFAVGEEDYLNIKELSSREQRFGAAFLYHVNRNLITHFRGVASEFEQTDNPLGDGYRQSEFVLTLGFPGLIRNARMYIYAGVAKRDFEIREDYTSDYLGARFHYSFYQR